MHKIDSANAGENGEWVAGNPLTGVQPTAATAAWFNAIQEEFTHYIESRGIVLSKSNNHQLTAAIEQHLNAFVTQAFNNYTPPSSGGTAYTHPTSHPASMILENASKRFVTDALISAWNSKANGSHSHAASDINQDDQHQFVTLAEKEKLNSTSGVRIEKHFDGGYLGQGLLKYGHTNQYVFSSDRVEFNSLTDTATVFVTLSLGVFTDETSLTDDYKYEAPEVHVWLKGYNDITEGNGTVLMGTSAYSQPEGVKGKYWQQFFKRLPLSTLGDYEYFGIEVFASNCDVPFSVNGADLIFEEYS